jgi:ornithine cyclodeaminase/alanine dehydrogenase-like protein (mu-crystallin family)
VTLTLGLFGCGGMGRRHLLGMKKLREIGRMRFELAGVCDLLPENAERAAAPPQRPQSPQVLPLRASLCRYSRFRLDSHGQSA